MDMEWCSDHIPYIFYIGKNEFVMNVCVNVQSLLVYFLQSISIFQHLVPAVYDSTLLIVDFQSP